MERYFDVRVKEKTNTEDLHLVHIIAPKEAIQGENIIFRGEGHDEQWRWEFGETGMIDSREKTALYAYTEPGEYEVLLNTENTRYPIRHRINILPYYSENDSTDVMVLIGLDIKEKLQNIADGKPFNVNYNYVVDKYLIITRTRWLLSTTINITTFILIAKDCTISAEKKRLSRMSS